MKPSVKAGMKSLQYWTDVRKTDTFNGVEVLKALRITAQKEREEIFKDIEKLICFDGSCSLINETDYWQLKQKRIE